MTGNPALHPDPTELRARRKIEAFQRRFGTPHLDFASHAAFPLALTPELLHFLWVNFPRDSQRQLLKIPWIATADLLLSSLCAPVGYEMFEMDSLVRRLLLDDLLADPRFGPQRVSELAEAMRYFLAPTLSSDNPALRALAQTQDLNTLAHERPQEALEKLALLLRMSIESGSVIEQIRLAALTEALSAALAHQPDFAAVLAYAQQRRRLLHGIAPAAPSGTVPVAIAGIELPSLDTNLPEPISPPQTAPSPAETMDQLIDAALLNPDPAQRALALTRLLPTLEHGSAARARLHKELIPAVQKITNQPDLLEVLNQYLAYLSPSSPPQYFEDMLQNIRRIPGAAERVGMLARLLELNALEQSSRALSEAVAALSALPQDGLYARLLVRLMPHMRLPERQKASHQVMEIAQKIQDSREQAELIDSVKQALASPPPPAHTLGEEGAEQDLEQPSEQPQADVSGKGVDAAVEAALRQGGVDVELHITGPGPLFTTQVTYTSQGGIPGDIMRSNGVIELPVWQQEWLQFMNSQGLVSLKMEEAEARMRVFGTALFSASFPDFRPGVFPRARSTVAIRSRLRLVFENALQFEDLPWEYLHDGRGYLFQNGKMEIIRHVPGYDTVAALPLELPLRLLVVCVAAADMSARRAAAAAEEIRTALQPLVDEKKLELEVLENPTISHFYQRLQQGKYHVVYYYGWYDISRGTTQTSLAFAAGDAKAYEQISTASLVRSLKSVPVQLLLLDGYERKTSDEPRRSHPAVDLLRQGVPAVIVTYGTAMSPDKKGELLYSILAGLVHNDSVLTALDNARVVLRENQPSSMLWGLPALYLSQPDGVLFAPPPKVESQGPSLLQFEDPTTITLYTVLRSLEGHRFQALMVSPAGQARFEAEIPLSEQSAVDFYWRAIPGPTSKMSRNYSARVHETGKLLSDALFRGEALDLFRRSVALAQAKNLAFRLRLQIEGDELGNLPWEFITRPENQQPLALQDHISLVRFLPPALTAPPPVYTSDQPLRALAMIANPADMPPFDLFREWSDLQGAFPEGMIDRVEGGSLADLRNALRQQEYAMAVIAGHIVSREDSPLPALILEDREQRSAAVEASTLAAVLGDHKSLRLVILLNLDGTPAPANPFLTFAAEMAKAGMPAVITSPVAMTQNEHQAMLRELYACLANGLPVDIALAEARMAMYANKADFSWGLPVLVSRLADGILFTLSPTQPPSEDETIGPHRDNPIGAKPAPRPAESPYIGLQPYAFKDAHLFYGREKFLEYLLNHLQKEPLVTLVGASGSGKTSFLQAGLLPALERGALKEARIETSMFTRPASQPLENLLDPLRPEDAGPDWFERSVRRLRSDPAYLSKLLAESYPSQRVVFIIDNFEELLTLTEDQATLDTYLEVVYQLINQGYLVILVLDASFESWLERIPKARRDIERGLIRLPSLTAEEMHRAILEPASLSGILYEEGVVSAIVEDFLQQQDPLPLLQVTLESLYYSVAGKLITMEDYQRIRPVRQAIDDLADRIFNSLTEQEQDLTRALFRALIARLNSHEMIPRPMRQEELVAAGLPHGGLNVLLPKLSIPRLLRTTRNMGQTYIELANPVLLRTWSRLASWVIDSRQAK